MMVKIFGTDVVALAICYETEHIDSQTVDWNFNFTAAHGIYQVL